MKLAIIPPKRITKANINQFYNNVDSTYNIPQQYDCVLDLSALEFVDTEGLNYIALLPFHLKYFLNYNVVISLPQTANVLSFLEFTGILDIYFKDFDINAYNSIDDVRFYLKKTYRRSNRQKVRTGVIRYDELSSFLSNEFTNIENLLNHQKERDKLCFSFYEITKNIFDHSERQIGSFSFHFKENKQLIVSISDVGIGIKDTLKNTFSEDSSKIKDSDYILAALQKGITCTNEPNRGLGLYEVTRNMEWVKISSGCGYVYTHNGYINKIGTNRQFVRGTSVYMNIPLDQCWV